MELKGRLSVVRSWKSADVPSLVKYANNINIARHLRDRFPHPYTAIDARRFVDAIVVARPVTTFAIDVGKEAVGGIGFSPGSDVERFSAEIGYWLGEPYWGRGIVAEALGLVSELPRSGSATSCASSRCRLPTTSNPCVFSRRRGTLRRRILRASSVKFGKPRDQALYALINPAWHAPTD